MNAWRTIGRIVGRTSGLITLVILAGWLALRSCALLDQPSVPPPPTPVREVFHASKPLRVEIAATAGSIAQQDHSGDWLERELRFVLIRGKMHGGATDARSFVLRIELPDQSKSTARVVLLAPDGGVERQIDAAVQFESRLTLVQSLLRHLPMFLGASPADWAPLIGTADAAVYEEFLLAASALLDRRGQGFTQPAQTPELARNVEQLEALVRQQPRFARAQGLLAIAYLALGGADRSSLTQIADATAKRALTLDEALADAYGAMGLVRLRRRDWIAARERFDAALALDGNALPALEGLACLHAAAGHMSAAVPVAERALALQPGNFGAAECLFYARVAGTASASRVSAADRVDLPVARVAALLAILSGDLRAAEQTLNIVNGASSNAWIKPLLRAAADRTTIPEALRAITRAAGDGAIDTDTEIVCGTALRQPDFVFNRMARLHKQNAAVPLRILWLPQTAFLRQHRHFEQIVTAVDLGSYWQAHGRPDICAQEPQVYGCSLRPSAARAATQPAPGP